MLYEKRNEKELSEALFQNPTAEYRDAPFWAWNTKLRKDILIKQIEDFKAMGFGGFHMHPRVGMDTPYLSEEFMEAVACCAEKAAAEDMLACLYDDDRYPSGTAGGLVTENPAYAAGFLLITPTRRAAGREVVWGEEYLVGAWQVQLTAAGELLSYTSCDAADADYFAYYLPKEKNGMYNDAVYVDILNKEAVERFVEITYPPYKEKVGEHYGKTIKTIFSDEACLQLPGWYFYHYIFQGDHDTDLILPWTHDFPAAFRAQHDIDLVACLPEVVWNRADGKPTVVKYKFFDMVAERIAAAFFDTCGARCKADGLLLTGHMNRENRLCEQTATIGEMMRGLRALDIPGIDMLYNTVELNTAKEAQSVAHQYGREGVLTELYGISNWDFDFRGYKYQGDWQAALGATMRVPHLSMMSLNGESKRDYPASIGCQSPWYKDFRYITDHFARLDTALTRGKPIVKVAVIHPVETYWLCTGPDARAEARRERAENIFREVTEWLLYGLTDFDFLAESLLPQLWDGKSFGAMQYDAIVVAGCETLRQTTVDALRQFAQNGGTVIAAGDLPRYTDGTEKTPPLHDFCMRAELSAEGLLAALEPWRQVDIRTDVRAMIKDGHRADSYLYTLRQDGADKWLFFASTKKMPSPDTDVAKTYRITVRGTYTPVQYNTLNGTVCPVSFEVIDGMTHITMTLYSLDSVLLRLKPQTVAAHKIEKTPKTVLQAVDFKNRVAYKRTEPNILLLDECAFSLDGGPWEPKEEILRIGNLCRKRLGLPLQDMCIVQPWTMQEGTLHTLELRFEIQSDAEVQEVFLCAEALEAITLNGASVEINEVGFYVDEAIRKYKLPKLKNGKNTLEVKTILCQKSGAEAMYLIGEFDTAVRGCDCILMPPTEKIGFGDAVAQGLAFYGGSLLYEMPFKTEETAKVDVCINAYRGAAVKVYVDGAYQGIIAAPPYRLPLGELPAGAHILTAELLGNRFNTFGALHNLDASNTWCTPYAWRPEGNAMSYEYHFREFGIIKSPIIEVYRQK